MQSLFEDVESDRSLVVDHRVEKDLGCCEYASIISEREGRGT
jgi:hypothetical protein